MPTHPVAAALLPVKQVHPNPDQPRKYFDLAEMEELKTSIKERGLINPISVKLLEAPSPFPATTALAGPPSSSGGSGEGWGEGPHYLIMAGERRFRACCDLGWTEIDARIWPASTPPEEVELLSIVENLQRKDLRPLEIARGYKVLTEAPYNLSQEAIANQVGKTQQAVAQYITINQLGPRVQEITIRIVNLGVAHYLQLCRIKTPEDQIALAKEAAEKDLSVKELKALVNKKLPLTPPKGKSIKANNDPTDRLQPLWSILRDKVDPTCQETWAVVYSPFTFTFKKEWGWAFGLIDRNQVGPERVAAWLETLAKGIREAHQPEPGEERRKLEQAQEAEDQKLIEAAQKAEAKASEMTTHALEMAQEYKSVNQKAADLWLPKNAQEAREMKASPLSNPRLPDTPAEWAEVEALAPSGPGAVYQWMLGASNYWTKKATQLTWKDLQAPDPITGCRQMIETLRQGKALQAAMPEEEAPLPPTAKPATQVSPTVPLPTPPAAIPPEVQAMIDRAKARSAKL